MTGPIIDPMWFYWLQVCDTVRCFFFILAGILGVIEVIICLTSLDLYGEIETKVRSVAIGLPVIAFLFAAAGILTPSKETMIEMEIARHVTYESTDSVIQTITNTASDLLEKLTEGGK